jgi:hypothetical protein
VIVRGMGDALLSILVKRGVDVTTIAHDGTKTMPTTVRRAVLARDTECVVDICSAPTAEVHHLKERSAGGEHSFENCRGLCRWCHRSCTTTATRSNPTATAPTSSEPHPDDVGTYPGRLPDRREDPVSKKSKKRKLKARRNKANHGRKPNAGR